MRGAMGQVIADPAVWPDQGLSTIGSVNLTVEAMAIIAASAAATSAPEPRSQVAISPPS